MRRQRVKFLLKKVKNDYSIIAKSFDETRNKPWKEFKYFLPYLSKGQKLLDVGCGNGRLFSFLKKKNINYIGVDNNKDMLKTAKNHYKKTKFLLAEQFNLPFRKEYFDHIWNIAAFHHLPSLYLRLKTLKEMERVLKKNGFLILTIWNLWQKKYKKYITKNNDAFIPWKKDKFVLRYYHAFKKAELEKLLAKAKFHIIKSFITSYNICFVCKK